MPQLTYRATLDYPPDDVFAFVADAENNPIWHEHVRATRWLDEGPTRLGRRGRQTGHLFGRTWHFVAEVVEFDPPRLVTFQVIEGYRVRTRIEVLPSGDGTEVTLTVLTPTILGRRVDALVSRVMHGATANRERGDIARLRAALAARASSPAAATGPSSTAVPPSG
jgi:uncharacterized membrane protein